jgi:hypothetical protein
VIRSKKEIPDGKVVKERLKLIGNVPGRVTRRGGLHVGGVRGFYVGGVLPFLHAKEVK